MTHNFSSKKKLSKLAGEAAAQTLNPFCKRTHSTREHILQENTFCKTSHSILQENTFYKKTHVAREHILQEKTVYNLSKLAGEAAAQAFAEFVD